MKYIFKLDAVIMSFFCLAASALLIPTAASAATVDTTKIVIGLPPGGVMDIFARTLADKLRAVSGAPVIVENRPGASGRLALDFAKRAAPDGKTILISPGTLLTVFPLTYKRLSYDPDKDLLPIAHLAELPAVVSTSVNSPYKTTREYVAWVKQNPTVGGVGMSGLGGTVHFGVLSLGKSIGVPLVPTPYRGAPMMLTDEVAGILPIGIDAIGGQMELYRAGKIRFLGITGTKRSALVPDVPTLKEQGMPDFDHATTWYGAFVPSGTPPAVAAQLEKAFLDAVKDPKVRAKMLDLGMEVTGRPGSEIRQIISADRAKMRPIVTASGFTADD